MMRRLKNHERITLAVHASLNRKEMGTIDDDIFDEVPKYLDSSIEILDLIVKCAYLNSDKQKTISEKLNKVLDKLADSVEGLMDGKIDVETSKGVRIHATEIVHQQKAELQEAEHKERKAKKD